MNENVNYEDVDEVIGLAAELRHQSEDLLSPEELAAIGEELGIPAEFVDRARQELTRRREQAERQARAAAERRRQITLIVSVVAGVLLLVSAILSFTAVSSARSAYHVVLAQAAEVHNVQDRQASVLALYADRPDSIDRDAEIMGAENRVRVATQRYNEAVATYNLRASRFPASLWLPFTDLPPTIALD